MNFQVTFHICLIDLHIFRCYFPWIWVQLLSLLFLFIEEIFSLHHAYCALVLYSCKYFCFKNQKQVSCFCSFTWPEFLLTTNLVPFHLESLSLSPSSTPPAFLSSIHPLSFSPSYYLPLLISSFLYLSLMIVKRIS